MDEPVTDVLAVVSNVTETADDFIRDKPAAAVIYLGTIILSSISGTLGNLLVICVTLINKNLRTVGNIFIINLAIADFFVTSFVDPFSIVGVFLGRHWFEDRMTLCTVIASFCLTSCYCSLLSIGGISFNRFIHICHRDRYERYFTFVNSLLMCASLWITSFLLQIPNYFGWGDYVFDKKTMMCILDRTADLSYTMFFTIVGIGFPVILIIACYVRIYMVVRASQMKVKAAQTVYGDKKEHVDSMRLARTLFVIFVVFATCWSPYAIFVTVDYPDQLPAEVHLICILLAHTNSSLNWILYGILNKNFRVAYIELLGLQGCARRLHIQPELSEMSGNSAGEGRSTGPSNLATRHGKGESAKA